MAPKFGVTVNQVSTTEYTLKTGVVPAKLTGHERPLLYRNSKFYQASGLLSNHDLTYNFEKHNSLLNTHSGGIRLSLCCLVCSTPIDYRIVPVGALNIFGVPHPSTTLRERLNCTSTISFIKKPRYAAITKELAAIFCSIECRNLHMINPLARYDEIYQCAKDFSPIYASNLGDEFGVKPKARNATS